MGAEADNDPKPALKFELLLTAALEKALQGLGLSEDMSKVADLQLAFDNADLLRLLELRANHLKAANFVKAEAIENELTRLKNEHFDEYMRPNTFYVTFKYEDTLVKAITDLKDFEFCKERISLKRAKEPTNIIWENRDVTKTQRRMYGAAVISIMAVILIGFFLFATWALQVKLVAKYYRTPPGVDCNKVIQNYMSPNDTDGEWALTQMAYHEVREIDRLDEEQKGKAWYLQLNQRASLQGSATCFCLHQIETLDKDRDHKYLV